jgi:hypothetical protein
VEVVLGGLLCGVGEVLFFSLCCRFKFFVFRVLRTLGFLLLLRLVSSLLLMKNVCALHVLKNISHFYREIFGQY